MPRLNWHLILFFLWISPHPLLGVLGVILYWRKLYREFPCFAAYVLYEFIAFIPLFILYLTHGEGEAGKQYAYVFSAALIPSLALRFGVIDEVSRDLFHESQFLKTAVRRLLQFVTVSLLIVAIGLAVYAPGNNGIKWHTGISVINRGAAMVQCGLVLSLLLFARFLGLSWRRPVFGITLGLAILTSTDLAASAVRAEFSSPASRDFLNFLVTGGALVCVAIWIVYLLAREVSPPSVTTISGDEVETWNKELERLVRR